MNKSKSPSGLTSDSLEKISMAADVLNLAGVVPRSMALSTNAANLTASGNAPLFSGVTAIVDEGLRSKIGLNILGGSNNPDNQVMLMASTALRAMGDGAHRELSQIKGEDHNSMYFTPSQNFCHNLIWKVIDKGFAGLA